MSRTRTAPALKDLHSSTPHPSSTGFVQRNAEIKRLLKWVEDSIDTPLCILSGEPGMGKSTLAYQFISHPTIQHRFDHHIFWLDTGENPTDLSDQINEIGFERSEEWTYIADIRSAIQQLYALYDEEHLLLVLEDVGTVDLTLHFIPSNNKSKVLILSRNLRLANAIKAPEITLHPFSIEETQKASAESDGDPQKNNSCTTGRIPLIVYLSNLCRDKNLHPPEISDTTSFEQALALLWTHLLHQYSQEYLTAIYALAIFPPLTPLSYPVLFRLSEELIPGIERQELEKLYDELSVLRILSHREHSNSAVTTDLFQHFVENYTEANLRNLHKVLLGIYPPQPIFNGDSPSYDEYIYRFLPYHLTRANQTDTLFKLLLSVEWISTKLHQTDPIALQQDYRYGRSEKTIRLVDEAIRLSIPALQQDKSQIMSQLIGRLQDIDIQAVKGLVDSMRTYRSSESMWLDSGQVDLKTPSSSLLLSLKEHHSEILSLDIDKEKQRIISSSSDFSMIIWDLKKKKSTKIISGLSEPAQQVNFISGGLEALSTSGNAITTWDLHKGKPVQTYRFHTANILSLYTFPGDSLILSSDEAGEVFFTDLRNRDIKQRFKTGHELTWALAATRDQTTAFTAGNGESIQVWDLVSGELKRTLTAHEDWIWALCTTKNDRFLLSASEDHTIIIWDLDAAKVFRVLKGHKAGVRFISMAGDDSRILSADEEQSLILWDFNTGEMLRSFTGLSNWMNDFKALPHGNAAFLASEEPELKLWSMSGTQRREEHSSHDKGIRALQLSPGDIQLISASDDATIRKWHVHSATLLASYAGHTDWISTITLSRSGTTLVSASFDKTLRVWDLDSGRCKRILKGHSDWVWCAAISANNRFIASGSEDRTIATWDVKSGKRQHTLKAHEAAVTSILISIDNRHIISASMDHTIGIWKEQNGELQHLLKGHTNTIHSISLSPMGDRVVSGSEDGTIRIWNFLMGMEDECLQNPGGAVRRVYALQNGYRVLSISEDYALRIWDLVESRPIFTLQGHNSDISHLAVSRDGKWAATAGSDCKLCLWDLHNGILIDSFYGDYPMTYCIFNIDGEKLIGADAGGGLHFLNVRKQH